MNPASPQASAANPPPPKTTPIAAVPRHKDFPAYLSKNQRAILYVPAVMTKKDYELLKRQIDNHLAVIEATSVEDGEGT